MAEAAAASPKSDIKALLSRALACLDRNDVAQADDLLALALVAAPDDAQVLQLTGVLRRMQGLPAEAETYYRRSLAIDPSQPQVHHNLGNLLNILMRSVEAVAEQREAIRLKPNYAEAHLNLAFALSAKGDHAAAEKSCRDALRIQPNYLFAKQALAMELNELDRPGEAERLLRQTLSLGISNPRQAAALEHNLAVALKRQERFAEALLLFDAAQAKAPDMPAVDYNRGNTLQQLGRLAERCRAIPIMWTRLPAPPSSPRRRMILRVQNRSANARSRSTIGLVSPLSLLR
jgi:protein O-GlcNAc transferase